MTKQGEPDVLRYIVNFLRFHSRLTLSELGMAAGVDPTEVSDYETGQLVPSEETLRQTAKAAGIDWSLVVHLRQFYVSLLSVASRNAKIHGEPLDLKIFEPALLAVAPYVLELDALEPDEPTAEDGHREASLIWENLGKHPIPFRRRLIELSPDSVNWALAVRICEASRDAATLESGEALELAELALSIAERAPGKEGWRSRLQGYCWAHIANARRVAADHVGADEAFSRAWDLWREGADSGPEPLADWAHPSSMEDFFGGI